MTGVQTCALPISVLLRADDLLAVVQEDVLRQRVADEQLRHGAVLVDLADPEAARRRLVERDVRASRRERRSP